MAADRRVAHGPMRAIVAPGVDLRSVVGPDGDPDRLLTHPRCRIVKFQPKVAVGAVESAIGPLYVKRYNRYAWRVVLGSLRRASPAFTAFANARALAARGFAVPEVVAAVEKRLA